MTDPQTPATEAGRLRWGDGDEGEAAVLADWDAELLADAFTWLHIRLAGGCFESHVDDVREYLATLDNVSHD